MPPLRRRRSQELPPAPRMIRDTRQVSLCRLFRKSPDQRCVAQLWCRAFGTAQPALRSESKMYTLIITTAIVVGLAFWVAAARLLRKLYWASRDEARRLRRMNEVAS